MLFSKKWSPKLIFLNNFWHKKLTLKVQFWHFLTNHNSLQDCLKTISVEHVDSWAKILRFRTHHLWNSTTELTLNYLPSKSPGTSPLAKRVFILSKKLESKTLDSSRMKQIFSPLHPERRRTCLRSSSKSSAVYLLWTLIWNTDKPFIQATNLDRVVLPEPDIPISSKWPWGCLQKTNWWNYTLFRSSEIN